MPRFATAAASFRERTEDRVLVWPVGEIWVVCVADGRGGVSGAAKAAEAFVAGVRQAIDTRAVDPTDPLACVDLLKVLDREIERDPVAGETTGIVLAVTPTSVVGASVGDSRAWLFTDVATELTELTELTEGQARKPRLGTGGALPKAFTAPNSGGRVARRAQPAILIGHCFGHDVSRVAFD
jgi:serine/threonine protein phosphatase PrpC